MTNIPTIVPAEVESPSLKEIGDFVRATGISAMNDPVVMNYLREIAGIPTSGMVVNTDSTEESMDEDSNSDLVVETHGVPAKGKVGQADYNAVYYGG